MIKEYGKALIAKNEKGKNDLEYGGLVIVNNKLELSKDIDVIKISMEEFYSLDKIDLIEKINEKCGSMLEEFEDDLMDYKQCVKALSLLNDDKYKSMTFYKCLERCVEMKTAVYFEF